MPSSKSTIFFLAALAVVGPVAMSQPANALQAMGPPPVRRAEHIHLAHKMTRKRSPSPRVVPIRRQDTPQSGPAATSPDPSGGGVLDPVLTESTVASSRTPDPNSRPSTTTQSQPPRQTITSTSSSSSTSAAIQSTSSSSGTRSTTTTNVATSSSTTQQASVSSNTPTDPTTTFQLTANLASPTPSTSRSVVLITTTSSPTAAPEQADKSKDETASFLPKSVLISLIVAASCLVAAVAIWTIIRKWKFGASRQFEDRLEPINWEPPVTSSGLPMDERTTAAVAIARENSVTSQRPRTSFGSSDGTHSGVAGGRNMAGSVAPDFPPAHDFTAGPSHLASGPGYADLQRGPSPLQRGPSPSPSMNYGGYGQQYSTPNPYDTHDYHGAYGGYGGVQQPQYNSGPGPHQF